MFQKISPEDIERVVGRIGKDWMLITVRDEENQRTNAMTASWGAMGVLWNKNVCICFVRPERYTHKLLEEQESFSIAFLGEQHRGTLRLCGKESGRDTDKLRTCGLDSCLLDGVEVISQAELVLICKKLYEDELKESSFIDKTLLTNYSSGGYHTVYVCEIKGAYIKGE